LEASKIILLWRAVHALAVGNLDIGQTAWM
jgi:hypothetical protein